MREIFQPLFFTRITDSPPEKKNLGQLARDKKKISFFLFSWNYLWRKVFQNALKTSSVYLELNRGTQEMFPVNVEVRLCQIISLKKINFWK